MHRRLLAYAVLGKGLVVLKWFSLKEEWRRGHGDTGLGSELLLEGKNGIGGHYVVHGGRLAITILHKDLRSDRRRLGRCGSHAVCGELPGLRWDQRRGGGASHQESSHGRNKKERGMESKQEHQEENLDVKEILACMKMLCRELKIPFRKDTIEKILRTALINDKEPTMELCAVVASILGLNATAVKVNPLAGVRVKYPSLIQIDNSFALIKESNAKGLVIASPSKGIIEIKANELSSFFKEGIYIILLDKKNTTPDRNFGIEWFIPALKKHRRVLIQVLIASFVVQLFTLANPLLIQVIIDKVINQRSLATLEILGIALFVVTILGGILGSLRTFLFAETTNRIDTTLGAEVIDHLLRLPLNYFDKRPVGELGTRVSELEKIRNFLTGQALTTILDAIFSLIYIFVMVLYSWLLTFVALAVVPIQIALVLIGAPLIRRQIRETAEQNAKTQSHLVEVLTGVQTVKAQNVEIVSRWKWQDFYHKYIQKTFERTITGTALGEISKVLQNLSQLLVLWVGASLVLKGQLTLGQLIAFRIISSYVTQPLLRLSNIWQEIQQLRVSFERLADIIDTPEESNHTSIQKRISAAKSNKQPNSLLPFAGNPRNNMPDGLPFQLGEYFILVEYSGRYLHPNKSGNIDYSLSPILSRVGLTYCDWKKMVTGIETAFKSSVSIEKLHNQRQKQTGFG